MKIDTGDDRFAVGSRPLAPSPRLHGRRRECELVNRLVDGVRAGRGAVLVVRGEAGIGKTTLLDYTAESASDLTVARATGVESEIELAFATLHQMCAPMLDHLEDLPGPQRDALGTAFGLTAGPVPDRFLVGLATLSLLSEAAETSRLVCLVDDAQWLDQASARALAFASRRLQAEPVLFVFAAREPTADFSGLPDLLVEGLSDPDARQLLASGIRWPFDEHVRDRIVAECRGNPRALLQLSRGQSPAQLAGGFGLPTGSSLSGPIEERLRQQLAVLPAPTRRLLLIASADSVGDPAIVWRAARQLGVPADAAMAAGEAGLLDFDTRVRFAHPFVRSAVYRLATLHDRQEVHRALAEVTDPQTDSDRRAWHRAHATQGPDDDVAGDLERSASRAQARGGLAAAAAFLERAAALTSDPALRAERALTAANAKVQAGAFEPALELLGTAEAGALDDSQRARADLVRAQLAYLSRRGGDAVSPLLSAAKRLERIDIATARASYLDAISAAMLAARLAHPGATAQDVARAAADAPPPTHPPRAPDALLDGLAAYYTDGYATALPILRRALAAFSHDVSTEEELRWLWPASIAALHLWDDDEWNRLSSRHVDLARKAGALSQLPLALSSRTYMELFAGRLGIAASLVDELAAVTAATGSRVAPCGAVSLAALRGREEETCELADSTRRDVVRRGEGVGITATEWAKAVLFNGLGRYDEAFAAAEVASEQPDDLGPASWSLVELIEAAVRSGSPGRATEGLRQLSEATSLSRTDWALGIQARSRAMLLEGDCAERQYREAIDLLARTRLRMELARAHLVYGEWLRRENRRIDARGQLYIAYEMLTAMGVDGFAQRARRELLATGETVRKRCVDTADDLTSQEAQIARLARAGLSNPEISTQLFISPRTVEWHLRKVFTKLGISSRRQLRQVLTDARPVAASFS